MNRGGIKPSTESACGGMDSKVARAICEDLIVVHYICGTEAPAKSNTQREVHVKEKRKDKKPKKIKCGQTEEERQVGGGPHATQGPGKQRDI